MSAKLTKFDRAIAREIAANTENGKLRALNAELLESLEAMLNADSGTIAERKDVRAHARLIIAKARN